MPKRPRQPTAAPPPPRPRARASAQPRSPAGCRKLRLQHFREGGGAREADWWRRPTRLRALPALRECALSPPSRDMADPEALGFEHMGLDPRLLQVPGRAERPGQRGWERRRGGALSRASCLLGRRRPGLVATHADPGEGHPAGPGGEGPAGSGPHGLGEDGRVRSSRAAAAAPQEGGGSQRRGWGSGAPEGRPGVPLCSALRLHSSRLAPARALMSSFCASSIAHPFLFTCSKKRELLSVLLVGFRGPCSALAAVCSLTC